MHDPIGETGEWLQQVVRGYNNYHAVPGNLPLMSTFRRAIGRYWWRVLRRRSQRCRWTWARFDLLDGPISTCSSGQASSCFGAVLRASALRKEHGGNLVTGHACPGYRWRDSSLGAGMALENLSGGDKGKAQAAAPARPKVLIRRAGADCLVVAMKRGNTRGAKGAGHSRHGQLGQLQQEEPTGCGGGRQLSKWTRTTTRQFVRFSTVPNGEFFAGRSLPILQIDTRRGGLI